MASYDDTATVSGSVVSFSNGADDVPTKSLVVTIPPTLSGTSLLTETQTGRNLFDISTATNGQINGTNGVYYANANWQASDFFPVHGENLTLSWDTDSSNYYQVNLAFYDSAKHYVDGSNNTFANIYSKTFTIPSGAVYCRASWSISVGGSPAPRNNIRINLGSTDGGYTPYTSPTQYTASLGRTIYGGTADIVNGVGTETYGYIVFDGSDDETWYPYINYEGYSINISTMKNGVRQDGVCNQLTNSSSTAQGQTNAFWLGVNTRRFYVLGVYQSMGSTVEEFKAYLAENPLILVYPLDAETDFTFEPVEINSRLGYNAFWSDEGDTEVTYYKSGYGFTSVTVHKETPDGEPVEQTAKLHKVIYGGQADVVKGRIEEHYPFYEISSFNGMFGKVNNGYCFYVQIDGTAHTLSDIEPNCMIANQLFTYGTVSSGSAPVWQYGGNDGTAKTHAFILPNDYDTLEKANAFLASLETPLKVTLKKTTPNVFTFPPISMETDENENTLFANEGESSITYRKETD